MSIKLSTGLRNHLLDVGSIADAFGTTGRLVLYGGAVPETADAVVASGAALVVIGDSAGGSAYGSLASLTFEAAASGVMAKEAAKTWSGTVVGGGISPGTDATFWRIVETTDGTAPDYGVSASATAKRIQGTIGTVGADGNLSSVAMIDAAVQTIDFFSIGVPSA